ncbi:MAG TPA: hypothetical protein VNU47_01610 [Candidatus Paceibacterota bacterium]|nr:hypothetical protein [Candidatus Paceibacterota bacterium]
MAHHAYFLASPIEEGIQAALQFAREQLSFDETSDVTVLRYPFFSVDDARSLIDIASRAPQTGDSKVVILAAARIFHEAQNALLKLFEEPSPGTTLILILPSEGVLLPTLRSRLIALPSQSADVASATAFLALSAEERRKYLDKLIERTKADKDQVKQEARKEALELMQALSRTYFYEGREGGEVDRDLLEELESFTRALHDRSAPLKLISEHLLLVLP